MKPDFDDVVVTPKVPPPKAPKAFTPPRAGGLYDEDGTLIFQTKDCGPEGPKG